MKAIIYILLMLISCIFSGCKQQYFLVVTDSPTYFYENADTTSLALQITKGKQIIVQKPKGKFRETLYFGKTGYIISKKIALETPYSYKDLNFMVIGLDSSYHYDPAISKSNLKSPPASKRNTGGEVQVKGYYRKDGTYVKPHTRSAPHKH